MGAHTPADRFELAWSSLVEALAADDLDRVLQGVQNWIEAWDECFWARDFSAFPVAYHGNVEVVNSTRFRALDLFEGGVGIDTFVRGREQAADVASWFRFAVTAVRRADDRLLALGSIRTRGRYSGILLRTPFAAIWTITDGQISRAEGFTSRRKAVAAFAADAP